MSAPTLEIFERNETYALAFYGPVLLQLWQKGTPLEGAQAARCAARHLAAADVRQTGSMVIVPVESDIPEKEARQELSNIPDDLARGVGLVLVQEGAGFRASAIRAVLLSMMRLSRNRVPHEVVPTVSDGAAWLARKLDVAGGAAGLCKAVADLRALYD